MARNVDEAGDLFDDDGQPDDQPPETPFPGDESGHGFDLYEVIGTFRPHRAPFEDVLNTGRNTFSTEVDGDVKPIVGEFDKLLVYLPKTLLGLFGGNAILEGLEKAAQSGSEVINNPNEPVKREHFKQKTDLIRETLKEHYIQRVRQEYKAIARNIPTLIINNMQGTEARLLDIIQGKYRPALEIIMSQEVEREFSSHKKSVEDRSRRFRDAIEQIEQLGDEMATIATDVPA